MTFRVTARTLLHLGAELISSDAVALYELVKNAFDAGSRRVTIDVVVRLPHNQLRLLVERVDAGRAHGRERQARSEIQAIRDSALQALDPGAPDMRAHRQSLAEVETWDDLQPILLDSNYILVSDTGEGMSLDTLRDVFLTIGTRSRLKAREQPPSGSARARPILGEKGVGRLSAMRLGSRLHVQTTVAGESHWNVLEIDWSIFSHRSDALLESFHIEPEQGLPKDDRSVSGTRLRISGLSSAWTQGKLTDLATSEFSKLTDPFTPTSLFPIQLRFNGEPISIPRFNKVLLENAHATAEARFEPVSEAGMRLSGLVRYKGRERVFSYEGTHLRSVADDASPRILRLLGPFDMRMYWYNRRILTALEGIGDRKLVQNLVKEWAGGLMVFRDGFRVMPYGGPDDDWLNLDRRALASSGYKVNRAQIIGRVNISSAGNPALVDQTNREGLCDSDEKRALVSLLKHVVETEFRTFLNETDRAINAREPVDVEELEQRVENEERKVNSNLDELLRLVPEQELLVEGVRQAAASLRALMDEVRELAASFEAGRGQLLNLAGIGLTVEVLAHELNRATEHALNTLAHVPDGEVSSSVEAFVRTLESQLKTLQKRLRILDPLSTAGRQRKESFDVGDLVRDTLSAHEEQFARERIKSSLLVGPQGGSKRLVIKAVKGMIVQVLENLLANSVYWSRQQRQLDPRHEPEIRVGIDTERREVSVTDNGPGVPTELRERVFEAFFTTKPAGLGKGLGLFIGREIARYHGADLYLSDAKAGPDNAHHTFVLSLGSSEQ